MKKLLLSTAIVAATSLPVFAQDAGNMFRQESTAQELHASDFIGMRVYRSDNVDSDAYEGVQDNWDDIGEINDVIISRDGNVEAVLVDIGGFLGIGENQVAVQMDAIRFVSDSATADNESDFFLVLNAPQGVLEEAPTYQAARGHQAAGATENQQSAEGGDANNLTDQTAQADNQGSDNATQSDNVTVITPETVTTEGDQDVAAENDATTEGDQNMAAGTDANAEGTLTPDANAVDNQMSTGMGMSREGYVSAQRDELAADDLTGAPAYDVNDKHIGEVSELLLADDGKIKSAIVDVGGFLGIGEKPVELELSKLDILRAESGNDIRVYISMSEEELDSLPEYED